MADAATCGEDWHADLVGLVQKLLDAPPFSPSVTVQLRDRIARLLAKHDLYDVDGWDADCIAEEKPEPPSVLESVLAPVKVVDWRDDAMRAADAQLVGIWWRCPEHGVRSDAVILCAYAYCIVEQCRRHVLSVGSQHEELTR